jgi:hypothetical protein
MACTWSSHHGSRLCHEVGGSSGVTSPVSGSVTRACPTQLWMRATWWTRSSTVQPGQVGTGVTGPAATAAARNATAC